MPPNALPFNASQLLAVKVGVALRILTIYYIVWILEGVLGEEAAGVRK